MEPLTLTVIGIVVTALIGRPTLYYQRRQTRLAELARITAAQLIPLHRVDTMARIRAEKRARIGMANGKLPDDVTQVLFARHARTKTSGGRAHTRCYEIQGPTLCFCYGVSSR
jgi:hypothetical protein